ncbi:uncharacterized protein BXZ73DRAFT_98835 [Epithele typhae]|uniref:uncharacterized protein n=1 Tax=Epithele typhae TaxID=378194 RepID=UPI002007CD61|nr:uncharacterized protein BXZ73DRAFT_98835 [Epithele typhae]KAH9940399.1 hypothetical protein BXZ73DRAFT_98835 [Epithele typhae]
MVSLSSEQRDHFLQHGWVKIPKAVKEEYLKAFTDNVWVRLGYDPDDKTSWTKEKIHMPRHREVPTKEFMPAAWDAMCKSCSFVPLEKWNSRVYMKVILPKDLGNWHIDGDWFTHFLDSGEQGLTMIVLFNNIMPRGGGTYVSPDGIANVVQWGVQLYDHPEGASEMPQDPDGSRSICSVQTCKEFVELTGEAGDVILLHPFMPHSASKNHLRLPRFITNPPVTLKEPLNLNRPNAEDYSLVELKILRTLGVDALPDWHIAGPRRRFTPKTRAGKDAMIMEEVKRMKAYASKTGGVVDSMHINGPAADDIPADEDEEFWRVCTVLDWRPGHRGPRKIQEAANLYRHDSHPYAHLVRAG